MEKIRAALEELLPTRVTDLSPVGGGDIGESFRGRTSDGAVFVKAYAGPQGAAMVEAEALGLAWLAEAGALRVPERRAAGGGGDAGPALLVLEWIDSGAPQAGTDEALGRGLAALHDVGADGFGFETDNFIGPLHQRNGSCPSWAEFYRDRRLQPMLEVARRRGLLSRSLEELAARLLERLPFLVGDDAAPARLHGDLWSGNWLCAAGGDPVLIDPAVYGGHREVDLAMMVLFGGFSERVFDAYAEVAPLDPEWRDRTPLYQLYPLLVHLNLFGTGYAAGVERALRHYV